LFFTEAHNTVFEKEGNGGLGVSPSKFCVSPKILLEKCKLAQSNVAGFEQLSSRIEILGGRSLWLLETQKYAPLAGHFWRSHHSCLKLFEVLWLELAVKKRVAEKPIPTLFIECIHGKRNPSLHGVTLDVGTGNTTLWVILSEIPARPTEPIIDFCQYQRIE
jgi:hypothetical protein